MRIRIVFVGLLFICSLIAFPWECVAQPPDSLVARWSFDEQGKPFAQEAVRKTQDEIRGRYNFVPGVSGTGLRFDGYTTSVISKWKDSPKIEDQFTVETWVALNAYPWNWAPLLDQEIEKQEGFFFGIDAFGHLGLHVSVGGRWQMLTSESVLPLKKWVHVAGSFDPANGLVLYVNGQEAGRLPIRGQYTYAPRTDLLIGRVRQPQLPFPEAAIHPFYPVWYSLDGILDEVAIYSKALSAPEIQSTFASLRAPSGDVLPYPKLPSGPPGPNPFGASYATLKYQDTWDRLRWVGTDSDVVVRFDQSPIRLVFWQGLNYIPAWVTENGIWYTEEFMEAFGEGCPDGEDCEPMSDKHSRYSHVAILESTPARAVVHWRYALAEVQYGHGAHTDPLTGWFDQGDEYWTIYPDGTALRKQILWTAAPKAWHQFQETIVINPPGTAPEDNIHWDALTLQNMQGETHVYTWKPKPFGIFSRPFGPEKANLPAGANIQLVNLKSDYKPFEVAPPEDVHIGIYYGENTFFSFECWNHWPVAQIPSSGRPCTASDRASHSSLSSISWKPYAITEDSITKIMLTGLTKDSSSLLEIAKSWLSPPTLVVNGEGYANDGFDASQRAFVLTKKASASSSVRLAFSASKTSPLFNPAILVKGWGEQEAQLKVNGKRVAWSSDYRVGKIRTLNGTDLIVWLGMKSNQPVQIELSTVGSSSPKK